MVDTLQRSAARRQLEQWQVYPEALPDSLTFQRRLIDIDIGEFLNRNDSHNHGVSGVTNRHLAYGAGWKAGRRWRAGATPTPGLGALGKPRARLGDPSLIPLSRKRRVGSLGSHIDARAGVGAAEFRPMEWSSVPA